MPRIKRKDKKDGRTTKRKTLDSVKTLPKKPGRVKGVRRKKGK